MAFGWRTSPSDHRGVGMAKEERKPSGRPKKGRSQVTKDFERQQVEYIISHYARECFVAREVARTSELTSRLDRSIPYFSRTVPQILGRSLVSALREEQLKEAARLLKMPHDLPLDEIAARSAFGARATFFRVFKARFGVTPVQYRQRARKR
jgi:AraC-like DNA-binding protein